MCAILGMTFPKKSVLKKMQHILAHRGPDDTGLWEDKFVGLGHCRLSILDVSSAGHQPMFYHKVSGASSDRFAKKSISHSEISIVFNGEIYNYLELKSELQSVGFTFTTGSDTEVILAAYEHWGENCVSHFNGMWAFAIYDMKQKKLFLSRDRFGVKPLYFAHITQNKQKKFMFASELKAFDAVLDFQSQDIDAVALEHYLSLGFIPAPWTIYKNISKLQAGHNLVYSLTQKTYSIYQYYELPTFSPKPNSHKLVESVFSDAVRLRLRSDVEVGAYLSGGIDSSLIVATMQEQLPKGSFHTFSVGFSGRYDETPAIKEVQKIFGTKHHHWYFTKNDFHTLLKKFSDVYDEPFADTSGFPTTFLNSNSKKFATVILSGDGGDEVFGGYERHRISLFLSALKKIPKPLLSIFLSASKKTGNEKVARAFELALTSLTTFYTHQASAAMSVSPHTKQWLTEQFAYAYKKANGNLVETVRIFDLLTLTLADHFLTKVDRASMNSAVEVRNPFLDYRLIELSQHIATKQKVTLFQTKKILRDLAAKKISKSIATRKKQGFEPPITEWLWNEKPDVSKTIDYIAEHLPDFAIFLRISFATKTDPITQLLFTRVCLLSHWIRRWR